MKLFILFLMALFFFPYSAFSQTVTHFEPGIYALKEGLEYECGPEEDEFSIKKTYLRLGVYHHFDVKPNFSVLKGDAPGDTDCTYDGEYDHVTLAKESQLTFSEVKKCKGQLRYKLVKKAVVTGPKIRVDVKQTGDPAYSYHCVWVKK